MGKPTKCLLPNTGRLKFQSRTGKKGETTEEEYERAYQEEKAKIVAENKRAYEEKAKTVSAGAEPSKEGASNTREAAEDASSKRRRSEEGSGRKTDKKKGKTEDPIEDDSFTKYYDSIEGEKEDE